MKEIYTIQQWEKVVFARVLFDIKETVQYEICRSLFFMNRLDLSSLLNLRDAFRIRLQIRGAIHDF